MRPLTFVGSSLALFAVAAVAIGSIVGSIVGSSSPAFDAPIIPVRPTLEVLLTGWGPFLGHDFNPSMYVALHLNGRCFDESTERPHADFRMCFRGMALPVNRTGVMVVEKLLESGYRPDAILHLGLENTAKGLKMEVAAANYKANDTGGPSHTPAIPGAPYLQPTTADLGRILASDLRPRTDPYATSGHQLIRSQLGGFHMPGGPLPPWVQAAHVRVANSPEFLRWSTARSMRDDPPSWNDLNVTDAWSRDAGDYVSNRGASCRPRRVQRLSACLRALEELCVITNWSMMRSTATNCCFGRHTGSGRGGP